MHNIIVIKKLTITIAIIIDVHKITHIETNIKINPFWSIKILTYKYSHILKNSKTKQRNKENNK